jgi:hypothetical protein
VCIHHFSHRLKHCHDCITSRSEAHHERSGQRSSPVVGNSIVVVEQTDSRRPNQAILDIRSTHPGAAFHESHSNRSHTQPALYHMAKRSSHGFVSLADPRQMGLRISDHHFLYDHCRCSKCFHAQTKQRLKTLTDVPLDIAPENVEYSETGIKIQWPTSGGHESYFPFSFLSKAAYDPPVQEVHTENT